WSAATTLAAWRSAHVASCSNSPSPTAAASASTLSATSTLPDARIGSAPSSTNCSSSQLRASRLPIRCLGLRLNSRPGANLTLTSIAIMVSVSPGASLPEAATRCADLLHPPGHVLAGLVRRLEHLDELERALRERHR